MNSTEVTKHMHDIANASTIKSMEPSVKQNKTKRPDVTIVHRQSDGLHVKAVIKALEDRGISVKVNDFDPIRDLSLQIQRMGDIIVWRRSSLDLNVQRPALKGLISSKYMINESVFEFPHIAQKYFQQHMLQANTSLSKFAIPTYMFKDDESLTNRLLEDFKLPVIAKPNLGTRGEGIELIERAGDIAKLPLPIKSYVFQKYIPNRGDWRVIIIGGRAVGAMKRVSREGSYVNNISRGATAIKEEDIDILNKIYDIAAKTAATFKLRFCGVDIILDDETDEYKVLEVNTAPQWYGERSFGTVTGIDVAGELADYIASVKARQNETRQSVDLVYDYYRSNIGIYRSETFHFASRLWLWSKDEWARKQLDSQLGMYIGSSQEARRRTIENIVSRKDKPLSVNQEKAYRKPYFEKYSMIPIYNALLFKVIFAENIYGIDIRPLIREQFDDRTLIKQFEDLISDKAAIKVLSTHAINFFYLLKYYFKDKVNFSSMVLVDPYELLEISQDYQGLIDSGELSKKDAIKLRVYLLTHAIIGESQFYNRRVKGEAFRQLCMELEDIIYSNYSDISLDNKCEFLVCAKICNYDTRLVEIILSEAGNSLSWNGNFIVENNAPLMRHILRTSEHRNVLYIMAIRDFRAKESKVIKKTTKSNQKHTIGRLARISIDELGLKRLIARVDTGATRSSICVSDLKKDSKGLHFNLLYPDHPLYTGEIVTVESYDSLMVKSASAQWHDRYAIPLTVDVGGFKCKVDCTLTDRQHMLYPVLLGRDFLKDRYIVDISRQFSGVNDRKDATVL